MERPPVATIEPPRTGARLTAPFRSASNWRQLVKFCVVGATGYGINLAVYRALLGQGLHYLIAETFAFIVAVTSNYTWNRIWTFRDSRGHLGVQGVRFVVVSLAALGANLLLLHLLIRYGGLGAFEANAIAIPLVTPLNFIGNKLWSFRRAST